MEQRIESQLKILNPADEDEMWCETHTLLELLQADAGIHDSIHLLKMLVLKRFNLAEMQIYSHDLKSPHINDLISKQSLPTRKMRGKHFRALCNSQNVYGKMHFESQPKLYWFITNPRPGVNHLFVGEGDCHLNASEFQRLQILLMTWEQWRALEDYKSEANALKKHLNSIKEISDSLCKSFKKDEILLKILETAIRLCNARTGEIFSYNKEKDLLEISWVRGLPNPRAEEAVNKGLLKLEGIAPKVGLVGKCFSDIQSYRDLIVSDHIEMDPYDDSNAVSTMCIPLALDSEALGVIRLTSSSYTDPFDETDQNLVEILATNATAVLKRALLYEQTITDPLTGLHNRKYFEDNIFAEITRIRRYSRSATMIMMDIDHFKRVNDTYGHHIGDVVLKEVARMMKIGLREMDVTARLGGEEFSMLLPETNIHNAHFVAERIRKQIESYPFALANGQTFHVTMSFGMVEIPSSIRVTYKEIYECADAALYVSKNQGRNRITILDYQSQKQINL